jgi:hypothetical protein
LAVFTRLRRADDDWCGARTQRKIFRIFVDRASPRNVGSSEEGMT